MLQLKMMRQMVLLLLVLLSYRQLAAECEWLAELAHLSGAPTWRGKMAHCYDGTQSKWTGN